MKTPTHNSSESGTGNNDYATGLQGLVEQFQDFKRNSQLKLASSRAGRIVLHLVLALGTCHFTWHFNGIVRELTRS